MPERTFGWVQDSQNISSLHSLVSVFDNTSSIHQQAVDRVPQLVAGAEDQTRLLDALNRRPLQILYSDLRGTRGQYKGLVQIVIPGQTVGKPLSEWASDNFVRWAHALGFISHDTNTDRFEVTALGKQYIGTPNDNGINAVLEQAILSYSPAVRVLRLLDQQGHLTKFEIGKQLGFVGESGFTNFPQEVFVRDLANPANAAIRSDITGDWEGSADRYARGIASWLIKLGWVTEQAKLVTVTVGGQSYTASINKAYTLTGTGRVALGKAEGRSRHGTTPKNIFFEMLATGNGGDQKYLRTRRGLILQDLKSGRPRSEIQIIKELAKSKIAIDVPTLRDDIQGLTNIGLNIVLNANNVFVLKDTIQFLTIPVAPTPLPTHLEKRKEFVRARLHTVPHEYLDLIDLSIAGNRRKKGEDRLFEVRSMALLNACGYLGGHRGGSNRPDGIFYTSGLSHDYGLIVDAKSYSEGFSCDADNRREMQNYVLENITRPVPHSTSWWKDFPSSLVLPNDFRFLFVSSVFVGHYLSQFQQISLMTQQTLGAGISADHLLLYAEELISGRLSLQDGYLRFASLGTVLIS